MRLKAIKPIALGVLVLLSISEPTPAAEPLNIDEGQRILDTRALARVMHCGAFNQGRSGMLAVADVVLNRVRKDRFPDTIYDVIHQRWQFTCVTLDRRQSLLHPEMQETLTLAKAILAGRTPRMTHADHYYNPELVDEPPKWRESMAFLGAIGDHHFYLSEN